MSLSITGKKVNFTQEEFNLATGLCPTDVKVDKDYNGEWLWEHIFGPRVWKKKKKMCLDIEKAFKQFDISNVEDPVKIALALFIETVIVGNDKKNNSI